MPSDVTREEFEARVGTLEREVEGEKLVTRHILEQSRRNGDDLAAVKTRLDRIEEKLDGVDLKAMSRKVDGFDHKIDAAEARLANRLGALERNLPKIVGDAVRDVDRERRAKPRKKP
jgi:hypothetical protein